MIQSLHNLAGRHSLVFDFIVTIVSVRFRLMMEQLPQIFLADHALYLETGKVLFYVVNILRMTVI